MRKVWLVVVALLFACNDVNGSPDGGLAGFPDGPETLQVEAGTGVTSFEPLTDGEAVDVIHGMQGGYHIWTAVRVHDSAVTDVQVNVTSHFEQGGASAGEPSRITTTLDAPAPDGARDHAGMRDFIDSPLAVQGQRVVLRVEVIANDGRHGTSERTVVPR
jgi:hypothetical protein